MKTIVSALIILFAIHLAPARAQTHVEHPIESADLTRLRTTSAAIERAVEAGYERSSTFRSLVETVACSDLIVYITDKTHPGTALRGLMMLVTATPNSRYIRIEVDTRLPIASLAALIGHELQHASEVAHAREIVDEATFRNYYRARSADRCRAGRYECYDTVEAISAGWRVSKELAAGGRTWFTTP